MTFKINSVGIALLLGASILVPAASAKELSPVDAAVADPGRPVPVKSLASSNSFGDIFA